MREEERGILKRVFEENAEGARAFKILKRMAGYDSRLRLKGDERAQCYALGRASLVEDIIQNIKENKNAGRNRKSAISDEY